MQDWTTTAGKTFQAELPLYTRFPTCKFVIGTVNIWNIYCIFDQPSLEMPRENENNKISDLMVISGNFLVSGYYNDIARELVHNFYSLL